MKSLVTLAVGAAFYISSAHANDFPTQTRVEYVLACMEAHGGQSYDTLYPCICVIDHLAARMSFEEYSKVETLGFLYSTPGERGGVFRDAAPNSRKRVKDFSSIQAEAEAACFVQVSSQ